MSAILWILQIISLFQIISSTIAVGGTADRSFVVDPEANCFRKDGKCFQYISGSMHYYRIPPAYWKDRLLKLKGAGFNTLQTYIPWNLHEPVKGELDFTGMKDLFSFLKICADLEILVLLRPGPFIAAEFEFGGFPSWLLIESPNISFRTSEPVYLKNVLVWYSRLLPLLLPHLYPNGGPVIGIQVENEYGSNPACDKEYLSSLTTFYRQSLGQEILLYTVDGSGAHMLDCGTLPQLYNTVDFGGGDIAAHFKLQARYNNGGPPVNSEFYPGWLSHWGSHFPSHSRTAVAAKLDEMLAYGASVSMYMFHGGSNFGFTSGAKGDKAGSVFVPHTTSYDYDAPLNEAGDTTLKYWNIRTVNKKYGPVYNVPRNSTKKSYGKVEMKLVGSIFNESFVSQCGSKAHNVDPLSFEENHQSNGIIVYSKVLKTSGNITLSKVRDRAYLLRNKKWIATVKGSSSNTTIWWKGGKLDIIVVSDGHINTGHVQMVDPRGYMKGITQPVYFGLEPLLNWDLTLLPLHSMDCMGTDYFVQHHKSFIPGSLFVGELTTECDPSTDTFLDTTGWGKGISYFQGINLGRHWPLAGPQLTLYAPGPFCTAKNNSTIVIQMIEFEQSSDHVTLTETPNLRGPIDPSQL